MADRSSGLSAVAWPASKPTPANSRMHCSAISDWVLRNRTRRTAPHSSNSNNLGGQWLTLAIYYRRSLGRRNKSPVAAKGQEDKSSQDKERRQTEQHDTHIE